MAPSFTNPDGSNQEELERLLTQGVETVQDSIGSPYSRQTPPRDAPHPAPWDAINRVSTDEDTAIVPSGDLQGAIGLFAEAAQDMATTGVELGLGRHFACVDFCNQAVEKAAQAVSLLRFGHRSMYDHDLRALGVLVSAPPEIQEDMAALTPFHPEAFYADTPPEEADEVISAEQASGYLERARRVLKWARNIVLRG